jgi:transposase
VGSSLNVSKSKMKMIKIMHGQPAAQPPLYSIHFPRRVSRKEFNRSIAPHLTKPQTGPKPKLSLYKLFNYVLFVVHTGIQWSELQTRGHKLHPTNVYKWHKRWSDDGSYCELLRASLVDFFNSAQLDANASETQSWMSSWGLCVKRQPPAQRGRVGRSPRVKGSSRHAIKIGPAAKTPEARAAAHEVQRQLSDLASLYRLGGVRP